MKDLILYEKITGEDIPLFIEPGSGEGSR